jgi:hypothetical protein
MTERTTAPPLRPTIAAILLLAGALAYALPAAALGDGPPIDRLAAGDDSVHDRPVMSTTATRSPLAPPVAARRPVLDPAARLLSGDQASEYWTLFVELDTGHLAMAAYPELAHVKSAQRLFCLSHAIELLRCDLLAIGKARRETGIRRFVGGCEPQVS